MAEIEIAVDIIAETDSAILVNAGFDKGGNKWLPKSQVNDYTGELKPGQSITIFISDWLAEEKELI